MSTDVTQVPLVAYLGSRSLVYYAKVLELRDAVEDWLSYIPQTFPHYTQHTIGHSEEILSQCSKLLFRDDDPEQPVLRLSAAEAYVLAAAAYLHDVGMVVPDGEKAEILGSDDWRDWTAGEEGGAKRWQAVLQLRQGAAPADPAVREFLADVQTRYLIAEFIRRKHHQRAARILTHTTKQP